MKRAVLVLLASTLAGCGGGGEVSVEVVDQPELVPVLREIAQAYERSHPGAGIDIARHGRLHSLLHGLLHLGHAPDLYFIDYRRLGDFAAAIDPLPAEAAIDPGAYFTPAVEAFSSGGKLQCVPASAGSLVVYYNRALFERFKVAPPAAHWNSRDLLDAAMKINKQDLDGDGKADTFGVAFTPTLSLLAPFLWSMDQDLVDDREHPTHLIVDHPQAMRVLSFVKQLNTRYHVAPDEHAQESQDPVARFAAGKLGLLIAGRDATVRLREAKDLDWDIAAFPRLIRPSALLDAQGWCMAHGAPHHADAATFLAWAAGPDGQAIAAHSGRVVPAHVATARSAAFLDPAQRPASAQLFLDQVPVARTLPRIAGWNRIEHAADPIVEEWLFEELKEGEHGGDPDEGGGEAAELAEQLREKVNPLLLPQARPPPAP